MLLNSIARKRKKKESKNPAVQSEDADGEQMMLGACNHTAS